MVGEPGSAVAPGDCETYDPPKSEISLDNVLRVQGYRDLTVVRDDVRAIATTMMAKAATLVAPTATFRKVPVDSCEGASLRLCTGVSFKSEIFSHVLRHCDQVLPFILTLGEALDNEVGQHLENGEIVEALFLETAGWLGIETGVPGTCLSSSGPDQKRRTVPDPQARSRIQGMGPAGTKAPVPAFFRHQIAGAAFGKLRHVPQKIPFRSLWVTAAFHPACRGIPALSRCGITPTGNQHDYRTQRPDHHRRKLQHQPQDSRVRAPGSSARVTSTALPIPTWTETRGRSISPMGSPTTRRNRRIS